ncbi:hypothetical protein V492_03141 [Pseudogymnoascus sp. VKM F-4246]|nr:hypothetical protein V492_03141 [Pseudogymnoascus sp. VKM F-4246]
MATQPDASEAAEPRRTRKAYRKRLLCMDDILSMSERAAEEPVHPQDYSTSFAAESTCHMTWGTLDAGPTYAISKPRRYQGLKSRKETARRKRQAKYNPAPPEKPAFPLLSNLPMELREIVYSHLLISNGPVILHSDWCEVQRNAGLDLGILRVCKIISEEATNFLYQHNIFHALVRDNSAVVRFDQCLYPPYVSLFRNVVIEDTKSTWTVKGVKRTVRSIGTLIESDVTLDSLTLVFAPKTLSEDEVAVEPIDAKNFAGLFREESPMMKKLARLRCGVLNLVVKLKGKVKVVVSLDIKHLQCDYSTSPLMNEAAAREGRALRADKAKKELGGLEMTMEKIATKWEEAVVLGVCRVMEDGEDLGDGSALMRV